MVLCFCFYAVPRSEPRASHVLSKHFTTLPPACLVYFQASFSGPGVPWSGRWSQWVIAILNLWNQMVPDHIKFPLVRGSTSWKRKHENYLLGKQAQMLPRACSIPSLRQSWDWNPGRSGTVWSRVSQPDLKLWAGAQGPHVLLPSPHSG